MRNKVAPLVSFIRTSLLHHRKVDNCEAVGIGSRATKCESLPARSAGALAKQAIRRPKNSWGAVLICDVHHQRTVRETTLPPIRGLAIW